jgi:predicted membrane chloride channel (bestrophin family)
LEVIFQRKLCFSLNFLKETFMSSVFSRLILIVFIAIGVVKLALWITPPSHRDMAVFLAVVFAVCIGAMIVGFQPRQQYNDPKYWG